MIGLVLAAGAGSRLHPLTHDLPKTLLPVAGEDTILDLILDNFAIAGVTEAVLLTGVAAHQIDRRLPGLQQRHGVSLRTIHNVHALERNNCYSLWLARELFADDVLLVNGDTVHPASVEQLLVKQAGSDRLLLAVDTGKVLAEEEMKTSVDATGALARISKSLDPATAHGEYIGVAFLGSDAAAPLAQALETTWRRDAGTYYEDGFQEHVSRGGRFELLPVADPDWVEVDNHADLARARVLTCRY